ncbi:MAG: hypothetical protein HF978_14230 [Desulfobacteraceae bacterium]|nr:hypothetical protein [Desulfobacteraceae bacterium]MBC2756696.1 hypothetical protein [Desulfobacteraceae bacterium]
MKSDWKIPDMPDHLSERSKELWTEYAGKIIKSPGRLALFQTGLEALDRAAAARKILATEDMITVTGRSGVGHAHPALKIEKESQAIVLKVWKTLNLHLDYTWNNKVL